MRFLFFNVVVLAALFMLAMKDGERPESLADGLKSAGNMVRELAVASIGENKAPPINETKKSPLSNKDNQATALPLDEFAKETVLRSIDATKFTLNPLTDKEKDSYAEDKVLPPPPFAPHITKKKGTEIKKPNIPKSTGRVQVADGQTFMSPKNRRRELNALARDMETIFLKKISE